uniref:Uncharacterized protein n=1 Tax=Laticauda laticaudata TaxID=8630 RepID=A0A8C5WQV6_LATLA
MNVILMQKMNKIMTRMLKNFCNKKIQQLFTLKHLRRNNIKVHLMLVVRMKMVSPLWLYVHFSNCAIRSIISKIRSKS